MQIIIKNNVPKWIMGKATAKVLYPFMLFSGGRSDVSEAVFRHEMEHVYQINRDGWFLFHIKYLMHHVRHGYLDNPYELAAKRKQHDILTPQEVAVYKENFV